MQVIKRDGRKVDFDHTKIISAIIKSFQSIDGEITEEAIDRANLIANSIKRSIKKNQDISIEEIQDLVEKKLMDSCRKDVAKAYIVYREERTKERNKNNKLTKQIGEKITASNVENQNANVDENSFGGRVGEATNVLMKDYALNYIMSEKARDNHLRNIIYTHDISSYPVGMHNCLSIPFDTLLAKGFNTRQTDVRSTNSVGTAFQLLAVGSQLQSLQQFGGVSATHLDWTMVPYVRKSFYKHFMNGMKYINWNDWCNEQLKNIKIEDYPIIDGTGTSIYEMNEMAFRYAMDMTEKECMQAVEGMYHNLNTLQSRSGNQLPFTSINYGTCTLPEGRLVIKCLLEGSLKGVGKYHKTPIFPCGIFQCMKGVNREPGDPNYDLFRLALKSTTKRLYPNYANVDWSGNAGYDVNDPCTYFSTMGCRTANGWDANGFGQLKDGRGNICPVTIIMPTLAMMAKEKLKEEKNRFELKNKMQEDAFDLNLVPIFMDLLDEKIHEAKDQLIERFEYICSQPASSAKFMYENNTMAGYVPEEGIISALKHGTLAIGNIGLAETLEILIGCNHTTEKGMRLAKRIYQLFKDRCSEFKKELHTFEFDGFPPTTCYLNFGVYNTPKLLGLGVA